MIERVCYDCVLILDWFYFKKIVILVNDIRYKYNVLFSIKK